ncbi:MAG: ATP-grasp domain-containing protein [Muribaculaceae bacterium]|nr:ATP-grasp domain-containing protein [Muribaculaceae bacterium]
MKKAIVLGGTFPHRHLIKKLKERGYYVLLVDYYENPIAGDVADRHIRISTLDKEGVLAVAREENVDLVITTCVDQANVTACYVAEKLGLPHPYPYETSLSVTNKEDMKRIMIENDIPTARHYTITSESEFDDVRLRYPLIIKPADSNSSKGVRKIEHGDENRLSHVRKALQLSRNGAAIVEEFKEGTEVGVDCMIINGKAHIIMTRERRKIDVNNDGIQQIYGSFWPADVTPVQLENLRLIAQRIASAFRIDNCPLMMQTIVNGAEINVIEFGARIGGGENYRIIMELTGYDMIDESINSFLGKRISGEYANPKDYLADNYIYMTSGSFGKMTIGKATMNDILYFNVYRHSGSEVGPDISSNNRVGAFVVKGATHDELLKRIAHVVEEMEVFDTSGQPSMRKDIYI